MRSRIAFLVAAFATTACNGGDNGGSTEPPPAKEVVTAAINAPATNNVVGANPIVSLSATASSTKGRIADANIAWSLNGAPAGTGQSVSISLAPGSNIVCVTATGFETSAQDCRTWTFTPTILCKIVAAHAGSETLAAPLRITFTKGGQSASKDVGTDGDCGLVPAFALDTSGVDFVVDASSGNRVYNPVIGHAAQADLAKQDGLTLVVIPLQFQIVGGVYGGQTVPIDLNAAFATGTDSSSFYQRRQSKAGAWWYFTLTFAQSTLPLPTNILVQPEKISDAGVAKIKRQLDSLTLYLGFPVTKDPVVKDTAFWARGAIVIRKQSVDASGNPIVNEAAIGGYDMSPDGTELDGGGIIYVQEFNITVHVTIHEMFHVLGFGHGCGWTSVMNQRCTNTDIVTNLPTAEDLAYMKLMYRVRELERKYNTSFSIGESHQGERVLMLGLQVEAVTHVKP